MFRIYTASNELSNRTKIGMSQIIADEDCNDKFCLYSRKRVLCQGGNVVQFHSITFFEDENMPFFKEKDAMLKIEKEMGKLMESNGYPSLYSRTQEAGHHEWFMVDQHTANFLIQQYVEEHNKENSNKLVYSTKQYTDSPRKGRSRKSK